MNIVIPKPVNEVLNMINDNGYEAYIIGGAVRNWVLGEKPVNYDISTNATIEQVQKCLKGLDCKTYIDGDKLCLVNSKFPMKIFKYRVNDNTLESYLATIDFTMNALAYSDEDGLIDYNTGVVDITNKVIKLNGEDDELFKADPLRILRAIRLSAEYGMRIDRETQEYMMEDKELLKDVAVERIRDELSKLMVTPRADFYIKKYFDIMIEIIPELALMEGFEQSDPHHIYDVLEHTLVSVKCIETNLELRLAMLFHDIAKPFTFHKDENGLGTFKNHAIKGSEMTREILNRLRFNKKTIQKVTKLIEYHDYNVPEDPQRIKQFLSKFGTEDIDDLFKVKKANYYAKNPAYVSDLSKINEDYERLKGSTRKSSFIKKNELKINGKDLLNLGVSQESLGPVLDVVYNDVLAGKVKNNREKLIDYTLSKVLTDGYDGELNKK
jgi:tRNA nucleotidyltransferase (CCA-adding enzyme)